MHANCEQVFQETGVKQFVTGARRTLLGHGISRHPFCTLTEIRDAEDSAARLGG
jgi:hypothetical protein